MRTIRLQLMVLCLQLKTAVARRVAQRASDRTPASPVPGAGPTQPEIRRPSRHEPAIPADVTSGRATPRRLCSCRAAGWASGHSTGPFNSSLTPPRPQLTPPAHNAVCRWRNTAGRNTEPTITRGPRQTRSCDHACALPSHLTRSSGQSSVRYVRSGTVLPASEKRTQKTTAQCPPCSGRFQLEGMWASRCPADGGRGGGNRAWRSTVLLRQSSLVQLETAGASTAAASSGINLVQIMLAYAMFTLRMVKIYLP